MANTISDELNRLIQAKARLKEALQEKCGLTIGDSSTLDEFPGLIQEMEVGGGGGDTSILIDLIEGDIQTLIIPEGTTKIGDYAFYNVNTLTDVSIPNTVTKIGNSAFFKSGVKKIPTLPSTITKIDVSAFAETYLDEIIIPNTVTSIEDDAFKGKNYDYYDRNKLKPIRIVIPDSVTQIKQRSFQSRPIKEIFIGSNVKSFGNYAFSNTRSRNAGYSTTYPASYYQQHNITSVDMIITAITPPTTNALAIGAEGGGYEKAANMQWDRIFVPNQSVEQYKTASGWTNASTLIHPLAAIDYDSTTYTVTASGRDNVELYVDSSLIDSSVYTFDSTTQAGNHTVTVKSVDPSLGVLDEVSQEITI